MFEQVKATTRFACYLNQGQNDERQALEERNKSVGESSDGWTSEHPGT